MATITAKSWNGKTATCNVYVRNAVKSVNITDYQRNAYLNVSNGLIKLTANISPSNAYNKLTWTSSNTNVAIVNKNGYVRGLKPGVAYITATAHSGKKDTCKVVVSYNGNVIVNFAKKHLGMRGKDLYGVIGGEGEWCSLFACYCYNKNGALGAGKPIRHIEWNVGNFRRNGYANFRDNTGSNKGKYLPKTGDLIMFQHGSDINAHVGIVVSYNSRTREIMTIEGNVAPKGMGDQGRNYNVVGYRYYKINDDSITGFLSLNNN